MERRIIHLNIADFSVAVERLLDPSLKSKALIIAHPAPRAVVEDMSDEAYAEGVHKGMLLSTALQRCRTALVLPPRPEQYHKALQRCLEHAARYSPLVEQSSGHGHLYLDVTGTHRLFGPAPDIGWRLRNTLRRDLGLDPIWSVGSNKLIAKVASRLVKPRGEYIVGGGEEIPFLAPLPLNLLPGILPHDLVQLQHVNIRRVHQLSALSVQELAILCGRRAQHLYQCARGIDPSPVQPSGPASAKYTHQHLFVPDTNEERMVRAVLTTLVQQVGHSLRQEGLGARCLALTLTYSDGVVVTRQARSKAPLDDDSALGHLAFTVLYRAWKRRIRLRKIGIACSLLQHPVQQLSLLSAIDPQQQKNKRLSEAMDTIRSRCGTAKILLGSQHLARSQRAAL
ncbi:MAG: DNA polymerase Y family protein [Desulfobulbus sp.]|jgi:DNA polymerase-4